MVSAYSAQTTNAPPCFLQSFFLTRSGHIVRRWACPAGTSGYLAGHGVSANDWSSRLPAPACLEWDDSERGAGHAMQGLTGCFPRKSVGPALIDVGAEHAA